MIRFAGNRLVFALLVLMLLAGNGFSAGLLPSEQAIKGSPVYRFWSENFKHQFLTISEREKDNLIANDRNWRYDGIAYYAHPKQTAGATPLYRFWSSVFKGHFFTTSEVEKERTEQNPDWRYEGIAYYVYKKGEAPADTVPVYRLWSDRNHFGGHFYTTFDAEQNALSASGNYRIEGTAFHGYANPLMCKKAGTMMQPYQDSWSGGPPFDDYKQGVLEYHKTTEKHHNVVMFFSAWENAAGMYGFGTPGQDYKAGWLANQIYEAGATPMITWAPRNGSGGTDQPDYALDNISGGMYDSYIREYARDVKRWGKPVILRIGHEMNVDFFPWSCPKNDFKPEKFVQAFRHIRTIFREENASNAYFMWSPNYASPPAIVGTPCSDLAQLYPGDEYVDYIGVSAYNWGSDTSKGPGWRDLSNALEGFLNQMATEHPDKPVIIAEFGTVMDDEPVSSAVEWIRRAFHFLATRGTVAAFVYFDDFAYHNSTAADFRVTRGHDWDDFPVDSRITDAYTDAIRSYCK